MIEALSDKIFERGCLSCLAIWWRFCCGQAYQDMMDHILRRLPATKYLLSFTLDGNDWLAEIELYILQNKAPVPLFQLQLLTRLKKTKRMKSSLKDQIQGGAASRGLLANWDSECQWSEPIQFRIHINVTSQTHCPIIKPADFTFSRRGTGGSRQVGIFFFPSPERPSLPSLDRLSLDVDAVYL